MIHIYISLIQSMKWFIDKFLYWYQINFLLKIETLYIESFKSNHYLLSFLDLIWFHRRFKAFSETFEKHQILFIHFFLLSFSFFCGPFAIFYGFYSYIFSMFVLFSNTFSSLGTACKLFINFACLKYPS